MMDPIELIIDENKDFFNNLDNERSQTVKDYLDMVLSFAYGRATRQHKSQDNFAQRQTGHLSYDYFGEHGPYLALMILEHSSYVEARDDGIYVATEKGIQFMEDHYSGQELFGVKIR